MNRTKTNHLTNLNNSGHHIIHLNTLNKNKPHSLLTRTTKLLDPTINTTIVTKKLLNYFPHKIIEQLWTQIMNILSTFPTKLYLNNIHVHNKTLAFHKIKPFQQTMRTFTNNMIHLHYKNTENYHDNLTTTNFEQIRIHPPTTYNAPRTSSRSEHNIMHVISTKIKTSP